MHPELTKVELAYRHLRAVNPWSDAALVTADIDSLEPGVFVGTDIAVLSVDNHRARFAATRRLLAARVRHIDVAADVLTWLGRVSVCDPARVATGEQACPICGWSTQQLGRAGEDIGMPCAGVENARALPSALAAGLRAATLATREVLALAGIVALAPSSGRELRDDLRLLRTESIHATPNPACAADHLLAAENRHSLDWIPARYTLGQLLSEAGVEPDDELVLATAELVATAACRACHAFDGPFTRYGAPLDPCGSCGGERVALRRVRRVRSSGVPSELLEVPASSWFEPGDAFAVGANPATRSRVFQFPPQSALAGGGRPLTAADEAQRFERLPADWNLDRLCRTRIAFIGLGHVGAAVLHALAPLPWKSVLLLDRDTVEMRNLQAHALAAEVRA